MAVAGQSLVFTLTVQNDGPSAATGVVVNDPLPPNFALVSAVPSQGSCSGTTTVICNLGTLANGADATITISGTMTSAQSMSNTATVDANEPDPDPANNSATAFIGSQENIPTVSEIGLMLLAMMLAGLAVLKMRA
jgi:uncharacterized repeat protein (TIGR01451 family)